MTHWIQKPICWMYAQFSFCFILLLEWRVEKRADRGKTWRNCLARARSRSSISSGKWDHDPNPHTPLPPCWGSHSEFSWIGHHLGAQVFFPFMNWGLFCLYVKFMKVCFVLGENLYPYESKSAASVALWPGKTMDFQGKMRLLCSFLTAVVFQGDLLYNVISMLRCFIMQMKWNEAVNDKSWMGSASGSPARVCIRHLYSCESDTFYFAQLFKVKYWNSISRSGQEDLTPSFVVNLGVSSLLDYICVLSAPVCSNLR